MKMSDVKMISIVLHKRVIPRFFGLCGRVNEYMTAYIFTDSGDYYFSIKGHIYNEEDGFSKVLGEGWEIVCVVKAGSQKAINNLR